MCAGNELFFCLLYLLHHIQEPAAWLYWLQGLCFIICVVKTGISLVHLVTASQNMAALDVAEREAKRKTQWERGVSESLSNKSTLVFIYYYYKGLTVDFVHLNTAWNTSLQFVWQLQKDRKFMTKYCKLDVSQNKSSTVSTVDFSLIYFTNIRCWQVWHFGDMTINAVRIMCQNWSPNIKSHIL